MKRVIWAVIVVGFLVVSCGGGNIKKVQNGVFSNYDNTITVGKAIENNKFLKGGKWKAIEMNGRDYVTYTVKLTKVQREELITGNLIYNGRENKPNYGMALAFWQKISSWKNLNADALAKKISMSTEEVNQASDIIELELKGGEIAQMLTVDGCEMILSFVMNQDGSFTTNMLEVYTEVTLNYFYNLKTRYNAHNIEDAQRILGFIYRPDIVNSPTLP